MSDPVATLAAVDYRNLKITQDFIPWENTNRPGGKLNPKLDWWLTQHQTGNRADAASAAFHAIFVKNGGGSDNVSFHFAVDHLEAIQLLPLDEGAYHAGDGMEDYTNDIGGWGSIAMEMCVNYDNADNPARYLKAKQNAVALWVAVLKGDPRLEYGTGGAHRFSVERLAPHNRWSGKWCPSQLMNEGNMLPNTGDGPFKDAVRLASGIYPVGMDEGVAEYLFGPQFNPNGSVSKRWLQRGTETGRWPRLAEIKIFDDRTYYRFNDGWVVWKIATGGIKEL
jgi:hypothetical protein